MRKELYDGGYYDSRKVDISEFIQNIKSQGLPMVDMAVRFLEKYSRDYSIRFNERRHDLSIRNKNSSQSYVFGCGSKNINLNVQNSIQKNCGENVIQIGCVFAGIAGTASIFITESGKFYLDRRNKIADNEEEFWDYVFSPNEKLELIIDFKIYDILRKAGWYEGRKIDSHDYMEWLKKIGHTEILQKAVDFYEEFGELELVDHNKERLCTCLGEMFYFVDANHYVSWRQCYGEREKTNPVGFGDYYKIFVYETGKVYVDNGGMCGNNFTEAWNSFLSRH